MSMVNRVLELAVGLIAIVFILVIGMAVYYSGYAQISNVNLGATGNTTRTALNTAAWGAFGMTTPLPTIMAGVLLIGALIVGFGYLLSRR